MYENILKSDGSKRLAEIARSEVVVGIPTFKNSRTIANVVQKAAIGLAGLGHLKPVLAIVDGGSSDETVNLANTVAIPPEVRRVSGVYPGVPGKGSAIKAIFEMGRALRARVIAVIEADIETIEPSWIQRLVTPILIREYEYVSPIYTRALNDGAITDLIAYPMTRALYGLDVRQPMGGDFALSGELAAKLSSRDVWETDVARHGIDIWLSTVTINERVPICQVRLGTKTDLSRETYIVLDPTFIQSVGTLFRMLDIYRRRWPEVNSVRVTPTCGDAPAPPRRAVPPLPKPEPVVLAEGEEEIVPPPPATPEQLADAFRSGARRFARVWRTVLPPNLLKLVRVLSEQPDGGYHFPADLWAYCVYDFAVVYNKGEGDPDKVVAALLPLYFARVATILNATGGKPEGVEKHVQEQAEVFFRAKDYLRHRWETYVPWMFEGVR